MEPRIRKPTPNRILATRKFLAPDTHGVAPAAQQDATAPLMLPTASIWDQYGVKIAEAPRNRWVGMLKKVPDGPGSYRARVACGLCRIALADVFCDKGYAIWWYSGIDDLGTCTPNDLCDAGRAEDLIDYVLDLV